MKPTVSVFQRVRCAFEFHGTESVLPEIEMVGVRTGVVRDVRQCDDCKRIRLGKVKRVEQPR